MSTFFLYILPSLFILGAAGIALQKYLNKQCAELKEQIDVYYMRERYMNDLLNIDQLSLKEMNTLYKGGDKIIAISEEHALKNRALFSQLNITKAQSIIESAIQKKDWSLEAEKYIAQTGNNLTFQQRMQKTGELLHDMPPSLKGSQIHNMLRQKNLDTIKSASLPAVPEMIIKGSLGTVLPNPATVDLDENSAMTNINYMKKALQAARPVALLRTRSQRSATGFLVAPQLFLTSSTALPNPAEARKATIMLNYQDDENSMIETTTILNINPQKLFITDPKLNYTLVGIENEDNVANVTSAKITLHPVLDTDNITVIHHPQNMAQHISFFETRLTGFAGDFINYTAHTADGSIGGPVLDNDWQVIAMHHAVYQEEEPGVPTLLKEGVKITSIIRDIQQKTISLTRKQQEYLHRHLLDKNDG